MVGPLSQHEQNQEKASRYEPAVFACAAGFDEA